MIGLRVEGVVGVAAVVPRDDGAWSVIHTETAATSRVMVPAVTPRAAMSCVAADGALRSRTVGWRDPPAAEGDGVRAVVTGAALELALLRVEGSSGALRSLDGDVVLSVVEGEGRVLTPFGALRVAAAEHAWIPRSVPFRVESRGTLRALVAWVRGELAWPAAWRVGPGMLRRDAPLGPRDLRTPVWSAPPRLRAPEGTHAVTVRRDGAWWRSEGSDDPLACIGWEGSVCPVAFGWEAPLLGLPRGAVATLWESPALRVSSWVAAPTWSGESDGVDRAWMVVGGDGEPSLVLHPAGCGGRAPREGESLLCFAARGGLALTPDGDALAE